MGRGPKFRITAFSFPRHNIKSGNQVIRIQWLISLEFGDFTDQISSVGCKQRINITRNKPVGFCKVNYKVMLDEK